MSDSYFVRIRGKVSGPFEVSRLRGMIEQRRVSRVHEVSTDGKSWTSASTVEDLFPKVERKVNADPKSDNRETGGTQTKDANDHWYYVLNGEKVGPIPLPDLQSLLKNGEIGDSTLVWTDLLTEWTAAHNVPQLALLSRDTTSKRVSKKSSNLIDREIVIFAGRSTGWMMFLTVFGLTWSLLMSAAGIWMTAEAAQVNNVVGISTGLFTVVWGVVFTSGAILFNGFRAHLKTFRRNGKSSSLKSAFASLHTFSVFFAIVAIVWLAFILAVLIWWISIDASLPGI